MTQPRVFQPGVNPLVFDKGEDVIVDVIADVAGLTVEEDDGLFPRDVDDDDDRVLVEAELDEFPINDEDEDARELDEFPMNEDDEDAD